MRIISLVSYRVTASFTSFQCLLVPSNREHFSNAFVRVVCFGLVACGCVAVPDALTWDLLMVCLSAFFFSFGRIKRAVVS